MDPGYNDIIKIVLLCLRTCFPREQYKDAECTQKWVQPGEYHVSVATWHRCFFTLKRVKYSVATQGFNVSALLWILFHPPAANVHNPEYWSEYPCQEKLYFQSYGYITWEAWEPGLCLQDYTSFYVIKMKKTRFLRLALALTPYRG